MTLSRSPLKRKAPLGQRGPILKSTPTFRQRKCAVCAEPFRPQRMGQRVCGPACAIVQGRRETEKQDRAETKRKLDAMKSIPTLKAEAQKIFNEYVRTRDLAAGHGCICCGKFATAAALSQPGGAYDACHYRSRGSADHLRFDERNVHLGLKDCNTWGHKDYRGGLIARIGLEAVEALEADNTSTKWTRERLEAIKTEYRAKLRALKEKEL
jgi:hypothetical protein